MLYINYFTKKWKIKLRNPTSQFISRVIALTGKISDDHLAFGWHLAIRKALPCPLLRFINKRRPFLTRAQ